MTLSSHPDFWLRDPLAIISALNELLRSPDHLDVVLDDDQHCPAYLIAVDKATRRFRFRFAGEAPAAAIAEAGTLAFKGAAYGARIAFKADGLLQVAQEDANEVVYEAAFPDLLYRLQRREFFRARVTPPYGRGALWTTPAGGDIRFRLHDVSLSGVGLRCAMQEQALPRVGHELRNVVLDFDEFGTTRAHLRLVSLYEVTEFDFRKGNVQHMHLGCAFIQSDNKRDTFLQKLVYQLESANRL